MRLLGPLSALMIFTSIGIACQKEYSLENAKTGSSSGSLKTLSGDCMPSGFEGTFKKNVIVDSSNYVYVDINVFVAGTYTVHSDMVNGVSFQGEGNFETTGVQTVRLYATGRPITNGTVPYNIIYGSQKCIVNVFVAN